MFFETAKSILLMVSALFPIVNPIGGSPVFLLLTQDYSRESRKLLARRVAMNSFILLIVSMAVGTHILSFFGISLPVVQVGGGLIVVSTGWAMLTRSDQVDRGQVHQTVTTQDVLKNAFYPLTLPLTVGPGSISIAITLGANEPRHLGANVLALISPADRSGAGRPDDLPLLRICRPASRRHRAERHECDTAIVVIPAGVHRSTDFLERTERAGEDAEYVRALLDTQSRRRDSSLRSAAVGRPE